MKEKIFKEYLLQEASVFYLEIDKDRNILETNNFSEEMVGTGLVGKNLNTTFVDFTMNWDINDFIKEPSKTHLLNVNTFSGLPQTLYFHFLKNGPNTIILGKLDIKEIEKLRSKLLSTNNELVNLSRELQKNNAELEKLNQLKNQFLGMATHDLRKPLGLIMNFSEFLFEELTDLEDHQKNFLENIKSSAEYMAKIINDFLDVALIESGKFDIYPMPTDIPSLIDKCLIMANYLAKNRNISIITNIDLNLNLIMIDPDKIEQVINNLISNAIEHSSDNSTILLNAKQVNSNFILTIKDEGEGISKKLLETIFNPFSKAKKIKSSGKRSIGLGLAISKKIIDAHDGKLEVYSEPGKGSEFRIELPIKTRRNK